MNVAAAVMVMANRDWSLTVPISFGIRNLTWGLMDMRGMVIVIRLAQCYSGPVGGVAGIVLRLRHAVQVHGRQDGDAQTDVEVAKRVRQVGGSPAPCNFQSDRRQCRVGAG